ncbi:MAG: cation:proton antiporter [Thiogranum sp.]
MRTSYLIIPFAVWLVGPDWLLVASLILLALLVLLLATAICVILFERLGFGSILGFIVAGIIIGPHTPGPVATENVEGLQHIAELGVVLFLFTIGLEMRPGKMWSMRRLLFGLGSLQMLVTASVLGTYLLLFTDASWESAVIGGLGFAMSSTAIIMATLAERSELATEHGQTSFAILMAQDLWIVPVMALVPILAHKTAEATEAPLWEKVSLLMVAIGGIIVIGRYLLPAVLGYTAKRRHMEAFGIVMMLSVVAAAWVAEHAGLSMTLGAFLIGMLLSASDYRYQIEATIAPFKDTLMGLFFIAVGMSIDVGALLSDWPTLMTHVPAILVLKVVVLIGLILAFGIGRQAAIRSGFLMSQFGEFAFVLFGAAAVAGVLSTHQLTLGMLAVALSMILTPLMVKVGGELTVRLGAVSVVEDAKPAADLDRHVVVIGYEEGGQLICLMLEKVNVPYVAFDRNISRVREGKQSGRNVHFGDINSPVTQQAAGLGRADAAYVTLRDMEQAKAVAVTLQRLYPLLDVYVRVRTLKDQDELVAKGIKHAGTGYIESTLVRGSMLLKGIGIPEADVQELIKDFQRDEYTLIRSAYAKPKREQ